MSEKKQQISLEELEEMIGNANQEGLLMCMTDAEVNDVSEDLLKVKESYS